MNVDRMRRQSDRIRVAAAKTERDRWLAAMTPVHRARHATPGAFCADCFAVNMAKINAAMVRVAWPIVGVSVAAP